MARPWRIKYDNVLYHGFYRSNNQQDILATEYDRYLLLETDRR